MRSLNLRSFVSALQVPVLAIGMLFASGCFKTTAIIPNLSDGDVQNPDHVDERIFLGSRR